MRRRHAMFALLAAWCGISSAMADDYAQVHGRMVAAWQQDDMPGFAAAVHEGLALRPDYPPLLYNLSLAEERLQRPAAALDLLERIAAMGVSLPADERTFPALAADTRFAPIAARLAANALPAGAAETVLAATGESGFLPEGIALDPASGALYLGSVRQGRILRFHPEHGRSVFAADDPQHLWGVFGMAVADGLLWVATSAVAEVLAAALPEFDEPTLGVVHGERFLFVANAGWHHYADGATPPTAAPLVMSVPLPVER